jgi:hypothetical protein
MKRTILFVVLGLGSGCVPSQWKIHGGPAECLQMCRNWNLEFAGMVGIGNQDPSGNGATACVCQVPRPPASALKDGGGASSGGMAGPITAAQAAVAANAAANQMRVQQQSSHP